MKYCVNRRAIACSLRSWFWSPHEEEKAARDASCRENRRRPKIFGSRTPRRYTGRLTAVTLGGSRVIRPFIVHSTPTSLLERLKAVGPDADEWRRLHEIYAPLVRQWLSRIPGLNGEVPDIVQEVLLVVVRKLPTFERQRDGSFRCWLRTVTTNQVRDHWKRRKRRPQAGLGDEGHDFIAQLEDPASQLSRQWDQEHDRFLLERLLKIVQADFAPAAWEAFRRFAVDGAPAARVAAELNTTANAVLLTKSRILKRLRQEAAGLLD